jgi:hypothetical protein
MLGFSTVDAGGEATRADPSMQRLAPPVSSEIAVSFSALQRSCISFPEMTMPEPVVLEVFSDYV